VTSVLVANRGEVARRVFRTARRMGLRAIAVYSDADAREPFVREADAAIRIGPAPARDSYLSIARVVAAAREARAELVHPGYGFLAEDTTFARAVADAGLRFVGPPAEVLRLVGSKIRARASAEGAHVPVLAGYASADQRPDAFREAARRVGYPVLVKPSAGGGGKGMLVARDERELLEALASARRLATSSFGDGTLLLERYLAPSRHVEVQFLADTNGNFSLLGERDCSAQRRHQKVLEEAPAVHLDDERRALLHATAERVARAVGYVNAGTAEFLLGDRGEFFFIEVNARLQVEHPVTEAVLGIDLVEQQLRVALGERVALSPRPQGHAIEARVYAEDPAAGFVPATGGVLHVRWPEGVRVDAGVEEGSTVTRHYDPLLAKLIAHGEHRDAALRALAAALAETQLLGVRTNLAFLRALVAHRVVRESRVTTDFVEREASALVASAPAAEEALAVAAAAVYAHAAGRDAHRDPFTAFGAWRPLAEGSSPVLLRERNREHLVRVGGAGPYRVGPRVLARVREAHEWTIDGEAAACALEDRRAWAWWRGATFELETGPRERALEAAAANDLAAPLPGLVVAVNASAGQRVARGHPLVIVEAMKMELPVSAPAAGVVRAVRCAVGDQVERGQKLVDFEPHESADG
jgi:acetyl/propionyl-CoA carboxylase alpha subunit